MRLPMTSRAAKLSVTCAKLAPAGTVTRAAVLRLVHAVIAIVAVASRPRAMVAARRTGQAARVTVELSRRCPPASGRGERKVSSGIEKVLEKNRGGERVDVVFPAAGRAALLTDCAERACGAHALVPKLDRKRRAAA